MNGIVSLLWNITTITTIKTILSFYQTQKVVWHPFNWRVQNNTDENRIIYSRQQNFITKLSSLPSCSYMFPKYFQFSKFQNQIQCVFKKGTKQAWKISFLSEEFLGPLGTIVWNSIHKIFKGPSTYMFAQKFKIFILNEGFYI